MNRLLTATAAAAVLAALVAPQMAAAQATAKAKTQAAAAAATGKAATAAPATSTAQGTAWAVKAGATPAAGAVVSTPPPAAASLATGPQVVAAGDLIDTVKASGQFTTFLKAVDSTNLTAVLKNNKNLTLFAPTDAAFATLPPAQLASLMADKKALQKLMTHHIINAPVPASKIKGAKGPVLTGAGDKVELDGSGDVLKADNANIIQADVQTTNGILHVVDHVMIAGSVPSATDAVAAAPAPATTTTTTTTGPAAPAPAAASKPNGV
ncbi:MAG: fasciclin domain-containing protein [Phenylobacterium sp.]